MRQLIFQEYVTVDGYAADADGEASFFGTIGEHEAEDRATFERIDTMLLGAETYRLFAGVWPTLEHPIAPLLNALRKVVVSTTLEDTPWGSHEPATVVRDLDAVRALKAEDGKDIILWGSISLFHSLLAAGLVDEIELRVCPVLLGVGRPVFSSQQLGLELIEARPWGETGVLQRFRPTGSAAHR
ncbi:dihydrofolate reductase family protein [Kribbella albertanoniae]|uniref:Reductase n=1 Tax=Kribbella albertanoniae TaxID=1266829 RepID=A0A4R4PZB2_9ACTN|nr:dihydrofolate reductase family protein [Kribbella albertanoniae]TDC27940.1 reductase [Kribbella albertanoniae]